MLRKLEKEVKVFTLPWRNWNILCVVNYKLYIERFYLTLEELKLFFGSRNTCAGISFLPYLGGIEIWHGFSLRGLVLQFLPYLGGIEIKLDKNSMYYRQFCFYLTLEELKCGVPSTRTRSPFWFLPYLGGIEMPSKILAKLFGLTVFTLPWRNWNSSFHSFLFHSDVGFYLTLEELKLERNLKTF